MWGRSNLPQRSPTVPSERKFGPPLSKIPGSAPDSHLQGITKLECENNVQATTKLFNSLGPYVHPDKSILEPSQVLEFLGFVLNSMTMTVTLSHTKVENITQACKDLLTRTQPTIRDVQLS